MSHIVEHIIQEHKFLLHAISKNIWRNPELGLKEKFAHELLTLTLEKCGFKVQKHYILDTAFRAEFQTDREGPTIAVICEYDALPNMGHACGHNLIAEIGLAVGISIKACMENDESVCGKIVVLGTPAEENGGGKIKLIQGGAFKNIDAALMAHPQVENRLFPLILDIASMTIKYRMKEGTDPWSYTNAVDAAVICYNNVSILRKSINTKCRISGIMHCSSFEETELQYSYRAPTIRELKAIRQKMEKCAHSAADVTDCICEINFHNESAAVEYRGMVANKTIAGVFAKYAEAKGIVFRDDDIRICESAVSTDMGNVSHVVPSIQPEFSIGASPPHVNHTPGFAKVAGAPSAQKPTLAVAESLAMTAVQLMSDPQLMEKVRREFETNPHIDPDGRLRFIGK